tara:strand:- start:95 stop:511 length:417 start_codon:yes stop_codon:yes gene_type:complete
MKYLLYVPMLAIPLVAYNILMLTGDSIANNPDLIRIPLMANNEAMHLKLGDVLVMLGIIFLYFEILKATRASRSTIIDHALSLVVFIIFLVEYIVVAGAGTATFMILSLMSLLDVIAGFTITISTSRRDISFGGNGGL